MTTSTTEPLSGSLAPVEGPSPSARHGRLYWAFDDARTVAWRNLLKYVRLPQLLVFSTVQPVMFVLLFRYVFGGAIDTGPVPYVDYLMPGIFVQTAVFGAMATGMGLAEDANLGLLERFRSLPMARSAVLTGRTLADLIRNVVVMVLMVAVGYLVGFRFHSNVAWALGAVGLVLAFGYAFSWIAAVVGLGAANPEAGQAAMFPILFPLIFASSAFVPTDTMPEWLQLFAEHQPVSRVVNATRELVLGPDLLPPAVEVGKDVLIALAWILGILAVFAPLSVRAYRRKVT